MNVPAQGVAVVLPYLPILCLHPIQCSICGGIRAAMSVYGENDKRPELALGTGPVFSVPQSEICEEAEAK